MDRLDALLAERDPILFRQLFHRHRRGAIGEQGGDRGLFGFARLVGQPGFQLPVLRLVFGDFAAGNDDAGIPVEHVFVGDQRGLDHGAGGKDGDFPAHGAGLCGALASLARASSSLARPWVA
jgi:hypothetical protein